MSTPEKKPAKPSSSRAGGNRTLADLNRRSGPDSDSDSDDPQEYNTGGEKSGMLAQNPSEANSVDAISNQARQLGAVEEPLEQFHRSSSTSLTGTGRLLSEETVPSPPQQPQVIDCRIVFWTNGFTVDDGPLRRFDDPANASFLESIRNFKFPKELEPADEESPVRVTVIRVDQKCPEPKKKSYVPFQGVGRTLGGSDTSAALEPTAASSLNTSPTPSPEPVIYESLPSTSVQIRLADGTRLIARFNHHHTVEDIRAFINSLRPGDATTYQLQMMGFPPKLLDDPSQTIEQAGLANSVIIQKF